MGNACFGFVGYEVEYGGTGGFGTGSCGGRDGYQGEERLIYRSSFAKWCVDEIHEVCLGVAGIEVHEFGCIDD